MRAPKRLGRMAVGAAPLLSLRTILLALAIVPSIAMAVLWMFSTFHLETDWRILRNEKSLADRAVPPANAVYFALQQERRLSAVALADPDASRTALREQRAETDRALTAFRSLSDLDDAGTPEDIREAIADARREMWRIDSLRASVDSGSSSQERVFTYFTELIANDIRLFEGLSRSHDAEVTTQATMLADLLWAQEMLSREDAVLARGAADGQIGATEHEQVTEWIGAQRFLFDSRIEPRLSGPETGIYRRMIDGDAWRTKTEVEQALLASGTGADTESGSSAIDLPAAAAEWRQSVDRLTPQIGELIGTRSQQTSAIGTAAVSSLLATLITSAIVGLTALVVVVLLSVWLTSSLRRRIFGLRQQALELETRLPDVVERLRRGETVDTDAEVREVSHGGDELGQLGQALNLARRSAVETAVRATEQHRGFERLLQRIARRTQLLIGLQLKKLDEMERRHEDPEVLEGLFDLDHLTARLRRYEENLVILGGGQPQRRWRKPVRLLDVLRSAQGEVQDYRRVRIEVQGKPWLSERAVGPVVHVLAELMENAAAFSKPPTPVEVRAGLVGEGIVVEIEDRGLGMDPEGYERANRLITDPPRMDMLSRADDARLGLYVVARLAANLGLGVEFRPSVFGGTRAVVLIPAELVAEGPAPDSPARRDAREETRPVNRAKTPEKTRTEVREEAPEKATAPAGAAPAALPVRSRGRAMSRVIPTSAGRTRADVPADVPAHTADEPADTPGDTSTVDGAAPGASDGGTADPLPQRVRQASLVPELREPGRRSGSTEEDTLVLRQEPTRSGAAIGAFQRQSRIARGKDAPDRHPPTGGSTPGHSRSATEDRT